MSSTKSPLVSICILCYNHEKYVSRAIESCLNQTYENIEIIIVDNNSSDGSVRIIEEYNKKYERINFFKLEENIFPAGGLNFLVNKANGEYISLVSSDDYYELSKIELQLEYMLASNYTNSFTWANIVDDNSNAMPEHPFNNLFNRDLDDKSLKEFFISSGNMLCAASVMLHKSILKKYGLFDHRLLQLQDYELWLRIIKNEPINILQNKLTNYCVRNDGKNLSLAKGNEVVLRSNFEQMYMMKHILEFELELLSHVTGNICTEENKYKNLIDYYIKQDNYVYANGVLSSLYEKLGSDFKFPSSVYKDFFAIYSKYDFLGINIIQERDRQIQERDRKIQERDRQVQDLINIHQSLRLKNRLKRVVKKFIPKKIWKIMRYLKDNPSAINLGCHVIKTQGFKAFLNKVNEVDLLSNLDIDKPYIYTSKLITNVIKDEIKNFNKKPLISIIMPVYNVDKKWLDLAIKSIESQWYENWELCIVDDKSTNIETISYLKSISNSKIKIKYLDENINISGASNEALKFTNGEYITLMDNDDEMTSNALYEIIKAINETGAEFIYSDEDSILTNGSFVGPHFKPDYSPDLLLTHNYITHLATVKKSLIDSLGGFRSEFDGAQDHDLFLRLTEITKKIYHIPKVLYHWRIITTSTNSNPYAKPKAMENARLVMIDTLSRRGIEGTVEHLKNMPYFFRVKREIVASVLVSIVIPFKDKPELLTMCIESILNKSSYKNFEIIGISNNSAEESTFNEMKRLSSLDERVKFYEYNVPFNYSAINNYAVKNYAKGAHILLLNNDIEIISTDWIECMLEHSQRKNIGCVGAKLYYPDDTIQHAGVIIGIGGVAGHAHKCFSKEYAGYYNRSSIIQNLSAVTAACLMVKKTIYDKLEGLNEESLSVAFNDVDFCLRVQELGYKNIFTPFSEAYHHESISRGYEDSPEKVKRFEKEVLYMKYRHKKILKEGDPYYNPNLTLIRGDFSLI